jgi:hypothetical protein
MLDAEPASRNGTGSQIVEDQIRNPCANGQGPIFLLPFEDVTVPSRKDVLSCANKTL